jgi:hypothetical protein
MPNNMRTRKGTKIRAGQIEVTDTAKKVLSYEGKRLMIVFNINRNHTTQVYLGVTSSVSPTAGMAIDRRDPPLILQGEGLWLGEIWAKRDNPSSDIPRLCYWELYED